MTKEKEEIFFNNLGLVRMMASKYCKVTESLTYDDLYQIGCQGLIKAIDNFDESLGFQFSTYAVKFIRNEILLEIQNIDKIINIPPHTRQRLDEFYNQRKKTNITIDEYAKINGYKKEHLLSGVLASKPYLSLTEPFEIKDSNADNYNEAANLLEILPDKTIPEADSNLIYNEFLIDFYKSMNKLRKDKRVSDRDMHILKSYFGLGLPRKTYRELAKDYNTSFQNIEQIVQKMLSKIKKMNILKKEYLELCNKYDLGDFERPDLEELEL